MNKQLKDSVLGRASKKHRRFHSLINKLKRYPSDTGLVEDTTSSSVIIRVIVGLLLLHLALIGGALLRGQLKKSNAGAVVAATVTAPPTAAEQQKTAPAFPDATPVTATETPTNNPGAVNLTNVQTVAPARNTAQRTQTATAANHITQMPAVADDDTAEEVTPTAPARNNTAAPAQPAGTVLVKHLVASGDTWSSIAVANNTTVDALKAANPDAARRINLIAGSYIKVPVAKDSPQARTAAAQQAAAAAQEKVHVIAKGETLGGIARKYKLSLKKLMQLNGMTDADARKIRPGQKLKVSQ